MYNTSKYDQKELSKGYVRIMHAVPDAPNVDIYANDNLIANNLAFGDYTEYLTIPEGTYKISVYGDIGLLAIADANEIRKPSKAMIRFLHLSPNAPAVDITLPNGTVIFSNVPYKHVTHYIDVAP